MNKLAILGGRPVRKKPFFVEPMINKDEFDIVKKAMKNNNYSRYVGSNHIELGKILTMNSKQALNIKAK